MLFVLKKIIKTGRRILPYYYYNGTYKKSIDMFKTKIKLSLDKHVKFCRLDDVNFEKMVCSLFNTCMNIEGLYYTNLEEKEIYRNSK